MARFVAEYVRCGIGRKAAIRAGYGRGGAHVRAAELLSHPDVWSAVNAALEREGVGLAASARVIAEAHDATVKGPCGNREPDHPIRLAAARLNLRCRGYLAEPERP